MDIITFIKMGRLKWAGMSFKWASNDLRKEFLIAKPEGKKGKA
jgi:hypothetical protein